MFHTNRISTIIFSSDIFDVCYNFSLAIKNNLLTGCSINGQSFGIGAFDFINGFPHHVM